MSGDRRPKHVDVDKPRGYGKLLLRRWLRRITRAECKAARVKFDMGGIMELEASNG